MDKILKLGDKVRIKGWLGYRKDWDKEVGGLKKRYGRVPTNKTGVIVGVRILWEGYTTFQEYLIFTPTKPIKVYLVAVNLKQILRVLPEDIEKIEEV
ncbi:hypothetical protein THYS13_15130 [Thermoanaerobacter sp. YS13]|uniref:hypothetical protein n=1 Tax=Thermoanaerobacter sp. YS13 TaxID=1511746 RepID=UPI000573087B|nr:hypothetical protein [Thermoanaerobacter sp. YS13]KHO63387.1 hypothetical protein THYS13_15130 [Thermoanaerobacter sp. YS13]